MNLTRAVRGNHRERWLLRANGTDLGDGDLVVGEQLEQVGLEGLVGPIQLVDEQHRRTFVMRLERLQQRTLDNETPREHVLAESLAAGAPLGLGEPDLDHLARVVPLVDRRCHVEALVALQAQETPPERRRQHLGDLGLADPRFAFDEQRPVKRQGEKHRRRQAAVRHVVTAPEQGMGFLDVARQHHR